MPVPLGRDPDHLSLCLCSRSLCIFHLRKVQCHICSCVPCVLIALTCYHPVNSWIEIYKTQLASEVIWSLPSLASNSGFRCHKHLSKWTSNALRNDVTTEIWSWSALSSLLYESKLSLERQESFFSKKWGLIVLEHSSFWKLFTVYCF